MHFLESLEQLAFSEWVRESKTVWGYPMILFLHVVGMGIVAGIGSFVSLRLLGVAKAIEVRPLERLYPVMWFGFTVNALTGAALLLSSATEKLVDPTFYIKMVFIALGVFVMRRTRATVFANVGADGSVPAGARGLAWASLACWLGAIIAGRLLAYV